MLSFFHPGVPHTHAHTHTHTHVHTHAHTHARTRAHTQTFSVSLGVICLTLEKGKNRPGPSFNSCSILCCGVWKCVVCSTHPSFCHDPHAAAEEAVTKEGRGLVEFSYATPSTFPPAMMCSYDVEKTKLSSVMRICRETEADIHRARQLRLFVLC